MIGTALYTGRKMYEDMRATREKNDREEAGRELFYTQLDTATQQAKQQNKEQSKANEFHKIVMGLSDRMLVDDPNALMDFYNTTETSPNYVWQQGTKKTKEGDVPVLNKVEVSTGKVISTKPALTGTAALAEASKRARPLSTQVADYIAGQQKQADMQMEYYKKEQDLQKALMVAQMQAQATQNAANIRSGAQLQAADIQRIGALQAKELDLQNKNRGELDTVAKQIAVEQITGVPVTFDKDTGTYKDLNGAQVVLPQNKAEEFYLYYNNAMMAGHQNPSNYLPIMRSTVNNIGATLAEQQKQALEKQYLIEQENKKIADEKRAANAKARTTSNTGTSPVMYPDNIYPH